MLRMMVVAMALASVLGVSSAQVAAQGRLDVSGHLAVVRSGEFEATDTGIGARLGWRVWRGLGLEGEVTTYPGEFPGGFGFSGHRLEVLVGATYGMELGRVRPFAKVRPGWLIVGEADAPIACIAIFPPPLSCTLAGGDTLFTTDIGGGVDVAMTPRTFIRLDVGDRLVRYPRMVLDSNFNARDEAFFGHDVRFTVGGGFRF